MRKDTTEDQQSFGFADPVKPGPTKPERPRVLSPKQAVVMSALKKKGTLTLTEAVDLIGGNVYTNRRFHVGNVLSRMVERGMIVRVKPGLFRLPEK